MALRENSALSLSRRQKRLIFWKAEFGKLKLTHEYEIELNALLNTYALLTAKVAQAKAEADVQESENRILSLERELGSMFESARQATSSMNRGGIAVGNLRADSTE